MSNCLFCKIIAGEIPSNKVFENEKVLAFKDISPQAPHHIVIILKAHYANILEVPQGEGVMEDILEVVKEIAKELRVEEKGFRLVNNCKEDGGQSVDHLHFHLLAGRGLQWPPG